MTLLDSIIVDVIQNDQAARISQWEHLLHWIIEMGEYEKNVHDLRFRT